MHQDLIQYPNHILLDDISENLFTHEKLRLSSEINTLIKEHDQMMARSGQEYQHGFIFNGVSYRNTNSDTHHNNLRGLHGNLNPAMQDIMADNIKLNRERRAISQVLYKALKLTTSDQDRRDTLPEAVIPAIPVLSALNRTNEEAFTLRDDPRGLRQYQQLRPRIEFYSATRLLY